MDIFSSALTKAKELNYKLWIGQSNRRIGAVHYNKGDYEKALDYLEKSLALHKEIELGANDIIWSTTYLYLTYKQLRKDYDVNKIYTLIKEA